jgi:hypothetical protein
MSKIIQANRYLERATIGTGCVASKMLANTSSYLMKIFKSETKSH